MTRFGMPTARSCLSTPTVGASRFVGDPVDIVTGAVVDQETDFRLPGASFALSWVRRFDSRQVQQDRGVGRGFHHELDHELRFDLDGLTYVGASWDAVSFPFLERDGERALRQTLQLERLKGTRYRVHEAGGRSFEFAFASPHRPARLETVREGAHAVELRYDATGVQLDTIMLGSLGSLRVDWAQGRITRVVLCEPEPHRETELVSYRYDARGYLVEAQNAYKHRLHYVFDDNGRLTQKTDRRGFSFHFKYDELGRCVDSRGDDGAQAVQLAYRPLERTTLVTRHDAGEWRYQYDANGTITNVFDPCQGMQVFVVDAAGRVSQEVDPVGNVTRIVYDARGIASAKVDPLGHWIALPEDPGASHPLEHRTGQSPLEWEYGTLFEVPKRLPSPQDALWEVPREARALMHTADAAWGGQTRMQRNLQGLPLREEREDGKIRRWAFNENAAVRWQIDLAATNAASNTVPTTTWHARSTPSGA
jgi:YD repeat-containing protein